MLAPIQILPLHGSTTVSVNRNWHAAAIISPQGLKCQLSCLAMQCRSIDALAAGCGDSLHTLDVNGCTGIERRSRDYLKTKFPALETFVVHT